jgi:hypothetical protein
MFLTANETRQCKLNQQQNKIHLFKLCKTAESLTLCSSTDQVTDFARCCRSSSRLLVQHDTVLGTDLMEEEENSVHE